MHIVLSRKGFDSTAGKAPSPIVDGRPVSLPIPTSRRSSTCFGDLGFGVLVEKTTKGRIAASHLCHDDPLFADGHCWFGQCGSAQGHLEKQGVGVGDVFVFFGLFADEQTGERHHRIFGYMKVACQGAPDRVRGTPNWRDPPREHPHFIGEWNANNTIYHGPGSMARRASPALRLTREGGPLNQWIVPPWMKRLGLTYNDRPERWIRETELDSAKRGQEFVSCVGDDPEALQWLAGIVAEIKG